MARVYGSHIDNGLIGTAALIDNASIHNSIIHREAVVEPGAELDDCLVMDYVRICRGAKLRRMIVDRHNVIEVGARIGFNHEADRARYHVTPGGVVVPKGRSDYYARDSRGSGIGHWE